MLLILVSNTSKQFILNFQQYFHNQFPFSLHFNPPPKYALQMLDYYSGNNVAAAKNLQ